MKIPYPRGRFPALALTACLSLQLTAQEAVPTISQLIDALKNGEKQKRRDAALALSELGPKAAEAVPALILALEDGDIQVWFHSVTALARIGPEARPAIPALLEDLTEVGRRGTNAKWYRSAFALGNMGPSALSELRLALKDSESGIRSGVAKALGWFGEEAAVAVPDLVDLLGDKNEHVRTHAAESLGKIGEPALQPLKDLLHGSDHQLKLGALTAIQRMGPKAQSLSADLIKLSTSRGTLDLQAKALRALHQIGLEPEAHANVLWPLALRAPKEVRHEVVNGLLALPSELSVPKLTKILESPDASAQRWAADLLGRIGAPATSAMPQLVKLVHQNNHPENTAAFKSAIANMGPAAAEALFEHLSEIPHTAIQSDYWAIESLGSYGIPGLAKLIQGLQHENVTVRLASIYGIRILGADGRPARSKIERTLHEPNARIRSASLLSLIAIARDPDRYENDISRLLDDDDTEARHAAAVSVLNLSSASESIVGKLEALLRDHDAEVRLASLRALASIGDRAAEQADPISALMVENHEGIQTAAVEALGAIGIASPLAVTQIAHLAEQASGQLKLAALRSLGSVGTTDKRVANVYRAAIAHADFEIREAALGGFGKIIPDESEILSVNIAALEDKSDEVKLTAARNLGNLREAAIPATKPLMNLLADRDKFTQYLEALKQIPADVSQLETYMEGLDHRNPAVRFYACEQLGRLGQQAMPAVRKLERLEQRDRYSFVKRCVKTALERITNEG
ncbi:MAG: hypothetical protein M2R45_03011 [Verrucomicrobia subdivision 3 bacterium]|nr:hypothetical protein [Limisphaerales bacterium]MCS1416503.1 hypothetical protein [Limisphaerales bacterium]